MESTLNSIEQNVLEENPNKCFSPEAQIAIEDLSFREAMAELNSIVSSLEANTLELEESLVCYERGVALLANLQKRLSTAEQKVSTLMGELSGEKDDTERDSTLS